MAEAYFVFSDEAGNYSKRPSETFRRRHPFYIRANVRMSADDYRIFQQEMQELNAKYKVPVGEEIKWADIWDISQKRYRKDFLKAYTPDTLMGYCRRVFNRIADKQSLQFLFTISCVYTQPCYHDENDNLRFHLEEAFERVQMDMKNGNFATFIMDELNPDTIKRLKIACHKMTVENRFVKYKNVYHGVLTECSSQSFGIQLADFSAGIINGYLRKHLISHDKYEFACEMFEKNILPHLRTHPNGIIMGYGIREVPKNSSVRSVLSPLFVKNKI